MALNLKTIGEKIEPTAKKYDWKDVVLYALGVGAGFDELEYCYEERLKVIPSYAVATIFDFLANVAIKSEANLAGILHGEQDIIFHSPIPVAGEMTTEGKITHIYDKGADKGALVIAEADTVHSNGRKVFTNIFTLFCRKDGGFGGGNAPKEEVEFPDREPDFEEAAQPAPDQPLVYRLSGDIFALHVDPDFARASGFEKPIMHGLCTHGYACRAVIKHLFPGEPERMSRFRVRFSKTLYPGIPIRTQIWKIEEGKAVFRTLNTESGNAVIDRGIVEWVSKEEVEKRSGKAPIRFDDRVAIVTGAGAGLGRAYALELARRGAKVVVNDLGGSRDGSGDGSGKAADKVVDEIKALGGEAAASYDSVATVEGGRAIVEKAIEAFGRVDILINNAGILRDRSLLKLSREDWDMVLAVHLNGAYNVTRPALAKMREGKYGRIVMTTSAAGLFGNFGQTNYSAAKMGLMGFMNTLKLEGRKYNIMVNAVAPIAATRLTEDVLPPDLLEKLKPEFVTPLVLYMCSEENDMSGGIYNAGMGHFSRAAIVCGPGMVLGGGKQVPTAEDVKKNFDKIASLKDWVQFDNTTEFAGYMIEAFTPKKKEAGADKAPEKKAGMSVADVFDNMPDRFLADKAAGVDVVFQYSISGPGGGEWYAVIKDRTCTVGKGKHEKPTTTIKMSDTDFVDLITGKLNAMKAYTGGKLKIEGDVMKSQLIEKVFNFK